MKTPVFPHLCAAIICACNFALSAAEISGSGAKGASLIKEDRSPKPVLAPASTEAGIGIKGMKKPANLKVDLWAAEPMFANPVAFCIDEQGRIFVSETHRYRTSVLDIRHYMFMLEDDMAARTVNDRIAYSKKHFGAQFADLERETEVIRLLEDRTGSGVANFSAVYADGFNNALDGIASGVLARKGRVWFTNIPELWALDGMDDQGRAKSRQSLSHGYGVRYSFTGHDMHGLAIGPDGRLYFSIGDRGANVQTKEGKILAYPDEGAVFRCNLDGSEMEVIYRGLRNPQELVFDQYGNLFTGDNDFDHGDEERLVYLVEGGDSGWRVGYQHSLIGFDRVPWKAEHIWLNHTSRQADYNGKEVRNRIADMGIRPAAYLPPISNVGDGPSGFVFNPGVTGLGPEYADHFFLAHFKGSKASSKIQSFALKPKGAGFEVTDSKPFLEETQPTDVDIGPDGALYFSDWGEGWIRNGKGRIYRVFDPAHINDPALKETKKLIAEGMDKRSNEELAKLLAHADRRVRQEAQFALVERKQTGLLTSVAKNPAHQLARLHGIWGLGQLGRKTASALNDVLPLLADSDAEVRAQSAKVLGEARIAKASSGLTKLLSDASPRVRMLATLALGKIGKKDAVPAVLVMLRDNDNKDAFVQHAGVMALVGINDVKSLVAAGKDKSAAVRLAAVVAMRKLERPEITQFLSDADPAIVIEAVRAINDAPIPAAMPALAALAGQDLPVAKGKYAEFFQERAINANFRLGTPDSARRLVAMLDSKNVATDMKAETLEVLRQWARPPQRDRIIGIYRPLPAQRDAAPVVAALRSVIDRLLANPSSAVQIAAAEAAVKLNLKEAGAALAALVRNKDEVSKTRVAALKALDALNDSRITEAIKTAAVDDNSMLRREANTLQVKYDPAAAADVLARALQSGTLTEQQGAFSSLAKLSGDKADNILATWLDELLSGKLKQELQLDLLDAAAQRNTSAIREKLVKFEAARPKGDALASFRETLHGGDAETGKRIFYEKAEAQCFRCHKVKNEGGEVGPDLTGIASKQTREYLLEAVVAPNAKIAPGFESYTVVMKNGLAYAGVTKGETETEFNLLSPEDGLLKLKKSDIKTREKGLSGMPDGMGQVLTKQEIRDLVEFLGTLK